MAKSEKKQIENREKLKSRKGDFDYWRWVCYKQAIYRVRKHNQLIIVSICQ